MYFHSCRIKQDVVDVEMKDDQRRGLVLILGMAKQEFSLQQRAILCTSRQLLSDDEDGKGE